MPFFRICRITSIFNQVCPICICGKHWTKFYIQYGEYVEWNCTYCTLRMRNKKTVCIRRIHRSTLNSNLSANLNQNRKYFSWLIRSSEGFFWLNQLKPKNRMSEYLYPAVKQILLYIRVVLLVLFFMKTLISNYKIRNFLYSYKNIFSNSKIITRNHTKMDDEVVCP